MYSKRNTTISNCRLCSFFPVSVFWFLSFAVGTTPAFCLILEHPAKTGAHPATTR